MSKKLTDRHHIIPKSRCRELGINPKFTGNVIEVGANKHRAWHVLFGNKTPKEAIALIEAEWSLSDEGQALFEKLSGNVVLMERKTAKIAKTVKAKKVGG